MSQMFNARSDSKNEGSDELAFFFSDLFPLLFLTLEVLTETLKINWERIFCFFPIPSHHHRTFLERGERERERVDTDIPA